MIYQPDEHTYSLTHEDVLPLLREMPGKDMVMNICRAIVPWENEGGVPDTLFYSSLAEFTLGKCGSDGKVGRIDSIITVWPVDLRREYCNVGLEVKCTSRDLMNDEKLVNKYVVSGMCDYYFLVTTTDELALMAVTKYAGNEAIGVASLASGRVMKVPVKMPVTAENMAKFHKQLEHRRHLQKEKFQMYYRQDDDLILLKPKAAIQDGPILQKRRE